MAKIIALVLLTLVAGSSLAQPAITRKQAEADIDYYVQTMKASHYAPFQAMDEQTYDARIRQIKEKIGDTIEMKAFVWMIYEVTALIGDAHSTPQLGQPAFREEYAQPLFFPYEILQDSNGVYASRKLSQVTGMVLAEAIVSINGHNMWALRKELNSHLAGLPAFRQEAGKRLFPYFLFLQGIRPPFVLEYRGIRRIPQFVTIDHGIPLKASLALYMPHLVKPWTASLRRNRTGYLDIRTLSGNPAAFKAFLDSAFHAFGKAKIRQLAIDLRHNSGGNTDLGDTLFSYISRKPYTWGIKSWRISQPYKDFLTGNDDTTAGYLRHENNTIWENADTCAPVTHPSRRDPVFTGKVYFITGPFTFSSAMALADVVKTYGLGTIVGEPTGENSMDYGEAFTITLPNSKVRIQSTSSFSHGADCHRNQNGPVLPDVEIRPEYFDDIRRKDRVLAWILRKKK